MKKYIITVIILGFAGHVFAQTGKQNVDKLCGCFEVSFKYAETFSPEKDYKFHEREQIVGVTELAIPIVNTDKRVVIQHLLVMANGTIVKHWREDWTYENREQWVYKGDKVWEKVMLPEAAVKSKWSQSVWEVTDAPRYQGSASWQMVNGHTIWESTADAPLPRREYTQRSDYNILNRTNRLVITTKGYDHIQENKKIIRTGDADKLLVEERGVNRYETLPKEDCEAGSKYWELYKGFWIALEEEWDALLKTKSKIKLLEKVGGEDLMTKLFAMADDWNDKKITSANVNQLVKATLEKHIQ